MPEDVAVVPTDVTAGKDNAEASATAEPKSAGENANPQATANDGEPETDEQKGKRLGGWQRKIQKLERELAEERAKNSAPVSTDKSAADDPEPDAEKYEDADKYYRDLAKWSGRQAYREAKAAEREAQEKHRKETTHQQRVEKFFDDGAELADDFQAVVSAKDVPLTDALLDVLLESDQAAQIGLHLAKNREQCLELARLAAQNPKKLAIEIGKLEAKFAQEPPPAEEKPEPQEPPPPPVSRAPKPATPVGKPSSVKPPDIHDPNLPFKEFVKLREAQKAKS